MIFADITGLLAAVLIARGFWEVYHQPRRASPMFTAGIVGAVAAMIGGEDPSVLLVNVSIVSVTLVVFGLALRGRDRRLRAELAVPDARRVASIPRVGRNPQSIALSADGSIGLVAARDSGTLAVVDLRRHQVNALIKVGRGAQYALPLPDGTRALVSVTRNRRHSALAIVDLHAQRVIGTLPGIRQPRRLALTPSAVYVTAYADHTVFRLDPQSLEITGEAAVRTPVAVIPSADGALVAVAAMWDRSVVFLAADSLTHVSAVKVGLAGMTPVQLALDASGQLLFVACLEGQLGVITMSNRLLAGYSRPRTFQGGVAAKPGTPGACYLVDAQAATLLVVSHPGGQVRETIPFGPRAPLDVATNDDGVYVACQNGTLDVLRPA